MSKNKDRAIRRRRQDSESSEGSEPEVKGLKTTLKDIRDLQKLRKKAPGLSAAELMQGTSIPKEYEMTSNDPLNLKTGGLMDLKMVKKSDLNDMEDDMKRTFSKESHLRDEDEEMRKYVEVELARRVGKEAPMETQSSSKQEEEDASFALPERLKKFTSRKNEEMLSNQMLCGIPEVELGVDAKMRNIEVTEALKMKLMEESAEKKRKLEEATAFNHDLMAHKSWDFVQCKRFNIAETTELGSYDEKRKPVQRPTTNPMPVVDADNDTPAWVQEGKLVEKPVQAPPPKRKLLNPNATDKVKYDKFVKKEKDKKEEEKIKSGKR